MYDWSDKTWAPLGQRPRFSSARYARTSKEMSGAGLSVFEVDESSVGFGLSANLGEDIFQVGRVEYAKVERFGHDGEFEFLVEVVDW